MKVAHVVLQAETKIVDSEEIASQDEDLAITNTASANSTGRLLTETRHHGCSDYIDVENALARLTEPIEEYVFQVLGEKELGLRQGLGWTTGNDRIFTKIDAVVFDIEAGHDILTRLVNFRGGAGCEKGGK